MCAFNLWKEVLKLKEIGVYIHIPFCETKCYYCDFISFPRKKHEEKYYIEYLLREIQMYKEFLHPYKIKTIFIGGGTPSFIDPRHISKILSYIYKNFNVKKSAEITLEANPGTLDEEKLKIYKESGINRISLGIQSANDKSLKALGRSHTWKEVCKTVEKIRKIGFKNINGDLIFGLPNEDLYHCEQTLEKVGRLDLEHISYYSLIIEENTPMDKWCQEGKINLPHEDLERKMYYRGKEILGSLGYRHYEISNFAKEGFESKHNLIYWELKPYIGLGLGSHSNLNNTRFWNTASLKDYYHTIDIGQFPVEGKEHINKEMEMAEFLILGLRLIQGIKKEEFFNRFNIKVEKVYSQVLEKHKRNGLLEVGKETIKLTPRGLDLSNLVFVDLLP